MSNSVEQQFSELSLSQEDHDQYEPEDHQDQRLVPNVPQIKYIIMIPSQFYVHTGPYS